jgi:hypothetical protein
MGIDVLEPSNWRISDAQLIMFAHDQEVRSTGGPRFEAKEDGLDQVRDCFAYQHPVLFMNVSHVDRPPFVPRPPDLASTDMTGHRT